ncbi:MAG: hypothetical protein A2V77_17220 [Anaeromyxobacter sp. RBG_16_69_14]|nr:MAG: hypothetical protein A2V77_17220 [Anaeromyxobacter sp. RBG_16_69_14]
MDSLNVVDPRGPVRGGPGGLQEGAPGGREVLTVLFKHMRRMVCVFAAVAALVAVLSLVRRPAYEAQASILVELGREYRPELGQERPLMPVTPEEVLNSEAQVLTSENLIRDAIEALGARRLYPVRGLLGRLRGTLNLAEAARRFRKDLSTAPVKRSSVLHVKFKHGDPAIAAEALHVLLDLYKQRHLEIVFNDTTLRFLQGRLREYEEKLKGSEQRWEAFRQGRGVFDYPEQMNQLLRQRADLTTSYRQAGVELGEIQRRLQSLAGALQLSRPLEVQGELQKDRIRLRGESQSRRSRMADVSRLLGEVDQQIREMDQNQTQLAALRREVTDDEKNHQMYKAKVEEMRLSSDMNQHRISNVNVIDEGAVPTRPTGPGLGLRLAIGAALALLSAVIYAFAAELTGQGMSTPEAAEKRLNLPVLVSVKRYS